MVDWAWVSSFSAFLFDMAGGYERGLWLERIDNEQGYSATNCCWTTPKQQSVNRRNTLHFLGGEKMAEVAEARGIRYQIAYGAFVRVSGRKRRVPTIQEFLEEVGETSMP